MEPETHGKDKNEENKKQENNNREQTLLRLQTGVDLWVLR
jgi:hypothetical protein